MIRRGQSRKAATKAKKDSGSSLVSFTIKAVLVLVAALALALIVPFDSFGADKVPTAKAAAQEATPAPTAEQREQARNWYRVANIYRSKAHKYHHRIGLPTHLPGTHGRLPYTGKLLYEKTRALVWKKRADLWYKKYLAYEAAIKPCTRAGFPRWYCPVLKKATVAEGKPRWYSDANLAWIIRHESGFNPNAKNPSSTAYGLFQFLSSTWGGTGIAQTSDPYWQTRAGIRYIKNRYYSPAGAKRFWLAHHWY